MDNTLTGAIPPGNVYNPAGNTAKPAVPKKRDIKTSWKFLGSTTALLVALGAVLDQGAAVGEKFADVFSMFRPATLEWTEDERVILEPRKDVDALTIEVCDSTQELGESLHIAMLLEKSNIPTEDHRMYAFVLKRQGKGCRGETRRVFMNPNDFDEHITQSRKADFILTYGTAHLQALDELVKSALEHGKAELFVNNVTGGNNS